MGIQNHRLRAAVVGALAAVALAACSPSGQDASAPGDAASTPTAAEHHTVAAVLSPRTVAPWRMITPPHRKPMPVVICAITRAELSPALPAAATM